MARQLYAEIASIEEQHVTQYESIIDPDETWLEKWLLHEASEVYNYWSCVEYGGRTRGSRRSGSASSTTSSATSASSRELFEEIERRDAAEVLPERLPEPIRYESQRDFVRQVLRARSRCAPSAPSSWTASRNPRRRWRTASR